MDRKNAFKAYVQAVINGSDRYLSIFEKDRARSKPNFNVAIPWPVYYEIEQMSQFPINRSGEILTVKNLTRRIIHGFFLTASINTMSKEWGNNSSFDIEIENQYVIPQPLIDKGVITPGNRYCMRFNLDLSTKTKESNKIVYNSMVKLAHSTSPSDIGDKVYTRTYMISMALAHFLDDFKRLKTKEYFSDIIDRWTADGFR